MCMDCETVDKHGIRLIHKNSEQEMLVIKMEDSTENTCILTGRGVR